MPILEYFKHKKLEQQKQEPSLKQVLMQINECQSQFNAHLTPAEATDPLITQMIVDLTFICPVFSEFNKQAYKKALHETMQKIKAKFPHLANAVDTFLQTLPEITPITTGSQNLKHQ